ncbi:MOSC N-terminal beta barrel domain-containing protein [Spongiactinospora sp. TRM90649]|uniref:MOSC domain-containing protein n=1 Tax=Spongiactinospora sp. TRM90649 TaxID=3031114 RepID=UPI0023F8F4CF|nr:MOSC N-terminal beta barrel domain-containing protein [Spongiactinospora sp. TRM90649]MDF5757436.1 MOSC domain-containing protein [Spongiactinospora sp. TRM90649]
MYIAGLWRYPVKSLSGEALKTAQLTGDGLSGDRVVHVASPHGPLTGRTRHGLLTVHAATGLDGVPRVAGHLWNTIKATQVIRTVAGPQARLVGYRGPERFDVLNLLVATDGTVAELNADIRRLRPNLLIGGVPPGAEHSWPGHELVIGEAIIGVHSMRQRCIVTSIDPDSGTQDLEVFRRIRQRFGNELALNCWVIRPGTVHLGDRVDRRPTTAEPAHLGGGILGRPYSL